MANGAIARKIAEEGAVLLKNKDGFLPLDGKPKSIALIGVEWFAGMAKMSPRSIRINNENVVTPYTVTPQQGLENVIKELGYDTKVTYNDGRDPKAAAKLAAESDVVLLMVGDTPGETVDRETLGFPAIRRRPRPGPRGLGEAGAADRCGSEGQREEHRCGPEDFRYGAHAVVG